MTAAFVVAGTLAVIGTLLAITRLNPVRALLYLIGSLLSLSVAFYTLGAPFAAALEIIIYAGAIVVLFLFVVMMINLAARSKDEERALLSPSVWIGPTVLVLLVAAELTALLVSGAEPTGRGSYVSAGAVSVAVFGPYVVGVELASFLLLAGVVGAFHLGRRPEKEDSPAGRSMAGKAAQESKAAEEQEVIS